MNAIENIEMVSVVVEKKDQAKQSKENQGKSKYSEKILKRTFCIYNLICLLEIIKPYISKLKTETFITTTTL